MSGMDDSYIGNSALACMVFMPFSPEFSIVYDMGIKPAVQEIRQQQPSLSLSSERADEHLVIDDDKVRKVIASLKKSDLVIADISGFNPNVLWELGFSHALSKPTIILSQTTKDLPFNIKNRDVLKYEFSSSGLAKLKTELIKELAPFVGQRLHHGASLHADDNIARRLESITQGIGSLERDSIVTNLVRNELDRFAERVKHLQEGKFDLRNQKPNREITKYFCDYVEQLRSPGATYDTVSTRAFWQAITDDGRNFSYLTANVRAGDLGAKIRRVFLLDRKTYPECTAKADGLLSAVLARHYEETSASDGQIETKVFFSEDYAVDLKTYGNFAVWRQGHESMLFIPRYDSTDSRMVETLFTYISERRKDMLTYPQNEKEIRDHESRFKRMWTRGVTLEEKHFRLDEYRTEGS